MSEPMDDEFLSDEAAAAHTYSVGELADAIGASLRRTFDDGVWVRGEIQGWTIRGPHAYFKLVEAVGDSKATVSVQFFGGVRNRLRPLLERSGLQLADGLKVRIFGTLDYYAPAGTLGLKMSDLDPRFTLGELALEREEVVRRLKESGRYHRNRGVALSPAPLRIGLVTSESSAAYADFMSEIQHSGLGFTVRLVDVRVQGDTAAAEIRAAVRHLGSADDLDVVVLVRGGGSKSDLATFDEEAVAIAVADCPLPVFTGIGHEIDQSVADEVAHRSLKTPTACAGALIEAVQQFVGSTEETYALIGHRARLLVGEAQAEVAALAQGIRMRVGTAVDRSDERVAARAHRVHAGAVRVLDRAQHQLAAVTAAVRRSPQRLDHEVRAVDAVAERVRLLDPALTMARGWSITRTDDGRVVRSAADLAPGSHIVTTFAKGTATSRVEEITP